MHLLVPVVLLSNYQKICPPTLSSLFPLMNSNHTTLFSQCTFKSNGGLVKLMVPLVEADCKLKFYSFKTMHFRNGYKTCNIEAESKCVIKDGNNNKVLSITELDEESCTPTGGYCMVPLVSAVFALADRCCVKKSCFIILKILHFLFIYAGIFSPTTSAFLSCWG